MADGKVVIDVILDDGTVAKGVTNIDRRLGAIAQTGRRVATGIKEIVTALGIASAASKAIDMINRSLDGAIARYDTLNNFPRVMQMIGFDASESEKAIQRLSDGIQGLPTRLDEVAKTAQNIAVMTGDLDGAVETTLALNNAFLASGASAMDAERGLQQYVQMLAKGEVDLQSWRTLQETMGVALNKTAEAFGFAGESAQNDLYEALKEGHITFDEFNAKLIELSEAQGGFAEMALEASGGIKTAWTNLRTWIVTGVADVIGAIDEALGGTGSIENAINSLKPVIQGMFGWIAQNIPIIVNGFRTVIDVLDSWIPSFEGVKEVVNSFFEDLTSFWKNNGQEILQNATTIFEGVRDTIQTAFDAIYQVISDVLGSKVMPFIQDQLAKIQQFWQENGEQIMQAVENAFKFIQRVIEAVMPAVKFIIEIVWTAIQDIISGALDVIMGLIKVFSGLFTSEFSKTWEGVKQIFKGAIDLILGWLSLSFIGGIRKMLIDLGKNSLNIVRGMWTNIVNTFKSFGTNAINFVSNMVKGVIDFFRNLLNQAISIFQQLRTFKANIWNAIREAVLGVVRGLFNGVIQQFSNMFSTVRNLTLNIKSTIVTIWNEVLSFLRGIDLTQIGRDIIQGLINGIGSMASAVVDKVKSIGESIISGFKSIFQISSPSKVLTQIGQWIGQGLANGIASTESIAVSSVKNFGENIVGILKKVFDIEADESKLAKEYGEFVGAGLIAGMEGKIDEVAETASKLAKAVIDPISEIPEVVERSARSLASMSQYVAGTALPGSSSNTLVKGPDGEYYTWEEFNEKFQNEGKKSGNSLVEGFIEGVKNTEKSAVSAVKKIANGVTGAIKNALGIKSPSRVFAEIGKNIVEGLVKGIEESKKLALKTTEGLAKDIQSPLVDVPINRLRGVTVPLGHMTPISGAFGVGSSITNNNSRAYNPTFNNYFTRDESTPSEVARKIKQQSQRLAMEWGLT